VQARAVTLERLALEKRRRVLGPGYDDAPPVEDPFAGILPLSIESPELGDDTV
jgi:hypothetical protein